MYLIRKIILSFLSILFRCYSYDLNRVLNNKIDRLYTLWVSIVLKSLGGSTLIRRPVDILGGKYISIGERCSIGKNCILNAWDSYKDDIFDPQIMIGDFTHLGEGCHISAIGRIIIGNNVLVGRRVSIIDNSHGESLKDNLIIPPSNRKLFSKGDIIIGDNVWISDKVSIMSGVKIGNGAIIGANAVVTKDVTSNTIVAGVPAKVVKIM